MLLLALKTGRRAEIAAVTHYEYQLSRTEQQPLSHGGEIEIRQHHTW